MKKTKEELIQLSKVYFENKDINLMHCTEDGNFFYENSLQHAYNHSKELKQKVHTIYRAETLEKEEEKIEIEFEVKKIKEPSKMIDAKQNAEKYIKKEKKEKNKRKKNKNKKRQ